MFPLSLKRSSLMCAHMSLVPDNSSSLHVPTFPSAMTENNNNYIKVLKIKGANGEERTMQFPMKLDLERPKRPRTTFSEEQLALLEEAYKVNGYLTGAARSQLAAKLGISDTQVKVWFQNRRTKDRRKTTDLEKPSTPVKLEIRPQEPSPSLTGQTFAYPIYYRLPPTMPSNPLYPFINPYVSY